MKKTKKFLVGLLSLAIMLVCPLTLTACKKECKNHTWGEWTVTTEATCTENGEKTRKCSKCPKKDTETIEALGHNYGDAIYEFSQDKLTCTASRTCLTDNTHVESETKATQFIGTLPTCEDAGYGHYEVEFENTNFNKQSTIDDVIDATGHDYEFTFTWSQDNLTCLASATCKNDNTHFVTEQSTSSYVVVDEPECEVAGLGKFTVSFENQIFETQTKEVEIPALNHDYASPIYEWKQKVDVNGDRFATCTASRVCQRNAEHKEVEVKEVEMNVVLEPNCSEPGTGEATVVFENEAFVDQVNTFEIPKLGHDVVFDQDNSKKATCEEPGFDHYVCQRPDCGYSYDEIVTVDHDWDGVRDCLNGHTCSVCGISEAPLGHIPSLNNELSTPATCTEDGLNVYTCQRQGCHYSESEPVYHTGHDTTGVTPTIKPVIDGEDCEYVYVYACNNCEEEVLGDTFIKHVYIASIKTPATCKEGGVKTYTCTGCGDHYDEDYEADPNAHNYIEDSSNPGNFECEYCGDTKVVLGDEQESSKTLEVNSITQKSEIVFSGVSITIDSSTLANASGNVTLTANKFVGTDRDSILGVHTDLVEQIGDRPIYNFTMEDADGAVDFTESTVTIKIPYTLGQNEDVDSIYVWFLGEDGKLQTLEATYSEGYVYFETNHFSHYVIVNLTPEQVCASELHDYEVASTVEATCTAGGYEIHVCSRCGHSIKTNETPVAEHTPVLDVEGSVAPTCDVDGYDKYSCSCGYYYTEVKPAIQHSYVFDEENSTEATCTAEGINIYVCQNEGCDSSYMVYTDKLKHNYEITETVPAKCDEEGYNTHTCTECGDSYNETISVLQHDYDNGVYTEHTQTEVGYMTYTCNDCGATRVEQDKSVTHSPNIDKATCSEDKYCLICGLLMEDHATISHKITSNYTPHTQTEVGYTETNCSVCGKNEIIYDEDFNHIIISEYVPHTQDEKGYMKHTCSICGKVEKEYDEEITHTTTSKYHNHTQTEVGYTETTCSICGKVELEYDENFAHDYPLEHATCYEDKACAICGHVEESHESVPHNFVDGYCTECWLEESA